MSTNSTQLPHNNFDASKIRHIVDRVFGAYTGSLGVRLWDGVSFSLGRDNTQTALAVPMIVLYLLGVAIAWAFGKKVDA